MKEKALNEIKNLTRFANAAGRFFDSYSKTIENPKCDKHQAQFNGDSRFTVFKLKTEIRFDALTGYYGNSGCSTFSIGGFEQELVDKYFVAALNKLAPEIFAVMAERAKTDASILTDDANAEIAKLQKMIDEAKSAA